MDRCALFVDAGYVLADGAMAVHGTRRRESVSWDYEGLLQLLAGLARERSGLPLLRCYWYEATVEGRRSADHDALADLPGVKLRLAKMRPGRREGVESEIHRDLTTLARNKAVSDAVVVSAEEDLVQVVADVQDLGLRVTLLHIAVDGNWTISRTLRQECDDIAEITSEHLRPYAELISGAEPPHPDEREAAQLITLRPTANGHGTPGRTAAYAQVPMGPDIGYQAPPSIYTAPVVAEYQRPVPQVSRPHPGDQVVARNDARTGEQAAVPDPHAQPEFQPAAQNAAAGPGDLLAPPPGQAVAAGDFLSSAPEASVAGVDAPPARQDGVPAWQDYGAPPDVPAHPEVAAWPDVQARPDVPVRADRGARQELYAAPVAVPAAADDQVMDLSAARSRPTADVSGYNPGAVREQVPRDAMIREQLPREPLPGEAGDARQPVPAATGSAQIHRLPTRGAGMPAPGPAQPVPGQPMAVQSALPAPTAAQPAIGELGPAAGYAPGRNGSYSGPQPVVTPGGQPGGTVMQPVPGTAGPAGPAAYPSAQSGVSLAEAVQSAHDEGQEFGASVARDAPALWLEAVLARKPRMPSDLEARLLQGSALPIDYLLHDEVRHALRRGFWDAMERARR